MNAIVKTDNLFLSVDQVAKRYNVSVDTIWRWRRQGTFPARVKVGPNCTRWRMSDLVEHESKMHASFAMCYDVLVAA